MLRSVLATATGALGLAVLVACGSPPVADEPPSTPPILTTLPLNLTTTTTTPVEQVQVYAVQPGNTLGEIAAGFDITVEALIAANGLVGTNLTIGQALIIPAPTTTTPTTSTSTG